MKSSMRRAVVPQQKHIQDELRLSQEKFAKAFQASPYGITISTREQGLIFEANEAYCRIVGYSLEELVGHSAVELGIITAGSRTAMLASVAAGGCVRDAENRVVTKAGATRVVSVSLDPIDVDGIPCLLGIMIDITERRQLEDALRASEDKLSKVFHANPAAILLSTRDSGIVLDANDAFLQLAQFAREEMIGRSSVELGILDASLRETLHAEFMAGGSIRNRDARMRAKNGQAVDVILSVESLEIEDVPCILTTVIDNRERKQAEQALRVLNCELDQRVAGRTAALSAAVAELERANAGKDAFIAAASHELRTPLTGILGMAETLASQARGPLNDHQARFVRAIQENGDRLLAMVNGVLNYTIAMSTGSPEHLDLCNMAELAASSARPARVKADKKQQTIQVEVQPPDLIIRSDGDAILQILSALLDNAVKFTSPQGSLGVNICAGAGDEAVRIEVWDTGIGISAEQMPYLFQPFTQIDQRLAREFDGIGLGLSLVRRRVELLNGTIAVESTPGSGSRFVVTLPNV
jgi:PAS domain S-box-containing protein